MRRLAVPCVCLALIAAAQPEAKPETKPLKAPPVVTPGGAFSVPPPSDSTVLFDGGPLSNWTTRDGKPATWKVAEHTMTVTAKAGDIMTKDSFGDCQIHIEFMTPIETTGDGQDRGNSGVYIHGRYEVQVLDSYKSETYPDGQCGAIYQKHVPLVNACRAQGEWQTYDIIFRAPKFEGKKVANAVVTVIHNGVLIHDHAEINGPTGGAVGQDEKPTGPILLQEHGHEVKYRNVWVRKL